MLKYFKLFCRNLLPAMAFFSGVAIVQLAGFWQAAATPTNVSLIRECVVLERGQGRDGSGCIGRFYAPCRAKSDNRNTHDQLECLEREFVFWNRILNDEFRALTVVLREKDKSKRLQDAQFHWTKYQHSECRLPYSLFGENTRTKEYGMRCSIERTARRAIEMLEWREVLKARAP